MQVLADGDAERAEQDPGHETEVEIKKRREQGRQMADLEKALLHDLVHRGSDGSSLIRQVCLQSGLTDPDSGIRSSLTRFRGRHVEGWAQPGRPSKKDAIRFEVG